MKNKFLNYTFLKNNFFEILLCCISFFIPLLPAVLPVLTIAIVILFLLNKSRFSFLKSQFTNVSFILFIAVYFVYAIGMLYTINTDYGWKDLETKLSILIFPLLLIGIKSDSKKYFNWILNSFIGGCVTASLILILRATFYYVTYHQNVFFYESFSFYMHPSYLAMYFVFAISILLNGKNLVYQFKLFQKTMLLGLFSFTVLLLSSKAGILSLLIVYVFTFLILAVSLKKTKYLLLIVLIPSAIYFFMNYIIDSGNNRFKVSEQIISQNGLKNNSAESSTMRLLIWKTGYHLFWEHPIIGVGTGDVKDALLKAYKENEIVAVLEKKLNAHNQFIQTSVALGIIGVTIFLLSLFVPAINALKNKRLLYALFLFLIFFNCLFESILERQIGVMFFAFFNALLYYEMTRKVTDEHTN